MIQIEVHCKFCRRQATIDYEPNDIITESFCRNAFVCERCTTNYEAKKAANKQPAPSPRAYRDD